MPRRAVMRPTLLCSAALVALLAPATAAAQCAPGAEGIVCGGAGTDGGDGAAGTAGSTAGAPGGAGGVGPDVDEILTTPQTTNLPGTPGILAVSQGGSGGDGGPGFAVIGIGGGGGNSGAGGSVTIDTSGDIATMGNFSSGVHLRSLGGTGGNSGGAFAFAVGPGAGGDGGALSLINRGTIYTWGGFASGIFAESRGDASGLINVVNLSPAPVGGAGGAIEITNLGSIDTNGAGSIGVHAVSSGAVGRPNVIGANGGPGGDGGAVIAANEGSIATWGGGAHGIDIVSSGGDGGRGRNTSSAFSTNAGFGGAGGNASQLQAENDGSIVTRGNDSAGILAESRGGTGGDGGTGTAVFGAGTGGDGGSGGNGGDASAENESTIETSGARAQGIALISQGGNGGRGGTGSGAVANGGTGGDGGNGGALTGMVTTSGSIVTEGEEAHALSGTSLGGRGGAGGNAGGFWGDAAGGGAGGDGGAVTVINLGELVTGGRDAYGLFAGSTGGAGGFGGGAGGFVALGGQGGGGSKGGTVTVRQDGSVETSGDGSHGVLAISIGGGGGAAIGSGGLVAIGGAGGSAGEDLCANDITRASCNDGGDIVVTHGGSTTTLGDRALGVLVQSVGGGGGAGGSTFSWFSIGGSGGEGGRGGAASLHNRNGGLISTVGAHAPAILVESVGGGGGIGGEAIAIGLSTQVAVGGSAGAGGDGGAVRVTNDGRAVTTGYDSTVLIAQSVGGGGGIGGDATAVGLSALTVSVGGSGGRGGNGGSVDVANDGVLEASADRSHGIFAQSTGGGGGIGGSGFSAGASPFVNISVSVGGSGGEGGDGGAVSVGNAGAITTSGDDLRAIFAQSVGGGGGIGGSASSFAFSAGDKVSFSLAVSVGGSGGEGGDGGTVAVENGGSLVTNGDYGHAIQAQSVGGGGGVGGDASAMALASTISGSSSAVSIAVGGSGGAAGNGGAVNVDNEGLVVTHGERSYGIFAQSIGGGGGEGGGGDASATQLNRRAGVIIKTTARIFTNTSFIKGKAFQIGIAVGGNGGAAGDGGAVDVDNLGNIETFLYGSHGILAQSVGGGGGVGGAGSAESEQVPLAAGLGASIGVGGNGGASGDGGDVIVSNQGSILTRGGNAFAILAQSVGGGGGLADTGAETGDPEGGQAAGTGGVNSISISVGGNGGAAGDGGTVMVDQAGDITTLGKTAFAILAQSVGGGGGLGGDATNDFLGKVSVGGGAGAGGDGGDVTVTLDGRITTMGAGAHGVLAQSVGGGGGLGGDVSAEPFDIAGFEVAPGFATGLANVTGPGGNGGSGGAVTVDGTGLIVTNGYGAHGIFAQSVGGGGGVTGATALSILLFTGSNGDRGRGGAVTVDHDGGILANGENGSAIFAQSVGGTSDGSLVVGGPEEGGGNIRITVADGLYRGGSGEEGAGIRLDNGAANRILVAMDAAVTALNGVAIRATFDSGSVVNIIDNEGIVAGEVLVAGNAGANRLNNLAVGRLLTRDRIDLAGGVLTNGGLVQIGLDEFEIGNPVAALQVGATVFQTTILNGSFVQTAGGELAVDVRFGGGVSDRLDITGSATLAGRVSPTVHFLENINPIVLITAQTGLTGGAVAARDTLALDYGFRTAGLNGELTLRPRFDEPVERENLKSVGRHINSALGIGGVTALGTTFAILGNETDRPLYASAIQRLSPEAYLAVVDASLADIETMLDANMACPRGAPSRVEEDDNTCVWGRLELADHDRDETAATPGWDGDVRMLATGIRQEVAPNWQVGGAFAWIEHVIVVPTLVAAAEGESYLLSGSLEYRSGGTSLTGAIGWGRSNYDLAREAGVAPIVTATGAPDLTTFGGQLRAAHDFTFGRAYARPVIDVSVAHVSLDAFQESGAGAEGLVSDGTDRTYWWATPGLELGAELGGGAMPIHVWLSGQLVWRSTDESVVLARLIGAPAASAPIRATSSLDEWTPVIAGGVDLVHLRGFGLSAAAEGAFGSEHRRVSGRVIASWRF